MINKVLLSDEILFNELGNLVNNNFVNLFKLEYIINSSNEDVSGYYDDNKLVGFISLFPSDCEEEKDLAPWYATMYVKKEYRNKGCSKILHEAIINEAKQRGCRNTAPSL